MKQFLEDIHPHLSQNGVLGFVNYFDRPDIHWYTRLLLAIDKRFIGLLQFAQDWVNFEAMVEHNSVPEVARNVYDYLALDLRCSELPREFSQTSQPAILLGLNHEAVVEPIIVLSLLDRNDLKFPGMKLFQYLGPNVSELILPLLPGKVATDYSGSLKPTLANKLDPIYRLYCIENKSAEEIFRQNQNSLQQAADHVSAGGAVLIFPNGGRSIDSSWYPGIAQIISRLSPDVIASTPIFPISLTGLARKQVYWKIHQAAFRQQSESSLSVNVYDPIYLPSWATALPPDELLNYLRKETDARVESSSDLGLTFPPERIRSSPLPDRVPEETII